MACGPLYSDEIFLNLSTIVKAGSGYVTSSLVVKYNEDSSKVKSSDYYSYVELNPITGRKHQLRKQLYNIGNPIVGDDKYSINTKYKKVKLKNIMLHAYKIKFMINNIKYSFKAEYDDEFEDFIKRKF